MFQNLAKRLRKTPVEHIQPFIPTNQRVYSIGDIHGRADLLTQLHEKILEDVESYQGDKAIVYLGDYIDRGSQSRQVIDLLLREPLDDFESIHLKGNHEQTMLDFIQYPVDVAAWLTFGGREALNSYGIALTHIPNKKEIIDLARQLDEILPDEHRLFLDGTLNSWQCGNYYFVHAGIRPGVALRKQERDDQLWIRNEFLQSKLNHGAIIVHGHCFTPEPDIQPNRIGIDTGAYASGVLSCLVLEDNNQRFLST